jgi:glucose-1-phosphate thymidylyltransferase
MRNLDDMEIVGLVPAAGFASRLAPLPFSKELFPVSLDKFEPVSDSPVKLVSHYLFAKLRLAEAQKVYVVIRDKKMDLPRYFLDGSCVGLNLAYIVIDETQGVPYTVDSAFPFINNAIVLFGFPDILFRPRNAFKQIVDRLMVVDADVVIGLFDLFPSQLTDRIEVGTDGDVTGFDIRTTGPDSSRGWAIAVWTPIFTRFLHEYLITSPRYQNQNIPSQDIFLAHVFQAALKERININSVYFTGCNFWDIGTPQGLQKALREQESWN